MPGGLLTSGTAAQGRTTGMLDALPALAPGKLTGPAPTADPAMTAPFDYAQARENMVEQQVRPWDVLDLRVLDVLVRMPREEFAPDAHRALAYADMEVPLAHGEAMFKPVLDGRALQALAIGPADDVLDIGSGSGYLTACMGRLGRAATGIERHADLTAAAQARLQRLGLTNTRIVAADAFAWETEARFDAICVGGAVDVIPERFVQWLKPGGRLFAVRGRAPAMEAVLLWQDDNGPRIESLFETELPYLHGAAPQPHFHF